jgi:hypothetical protein
MTVLSSVTGRVQPGRYEEFLSQGLEVSKLYERHGAQNVRLMQAVSAGEASNTWSFSAEFENGESHGTFLEEITADLEMQHVLARLRSPDSPSIIEQQTLATEVPLDRKPKAGRGDVVEIHVSRVTPGRLEDARKMAKAACSFAERHGARNARLFQLGYAGLGSGLFLVSWEFTSLRAQGKSMDAWGTDPKGQAIAANTFEAQPSSTLIFSGLYMTIPV